MNRACNRVDTGKTPALPGSWPQRARMPRFLLSSGLVRVPVPASARFLVFWMSLSLGVAAVGGEPFVPDSPDTVLVRLPPELPGTSRDGSGLRLDEAVTAARRHVQFARASGDPRALGRAEALLRPWWKQPDPPYETLLLRAEIHQGLHAFPDALADVEAVLRREPRHGGAWLLKATVHQVLGDYAAARGACLQLARFADPLTSVTATAALAGLAEDGQPAIRALTDALSRSSNAPVEVRSWSWTTLGELHRWQGDPARAEAAFEQALGLTPGAPYPTAGLADLLLSEHRYDEVLRRIPLSDLLLLRHAEALRRLQRDEPRRQALVRRLAEGFELARARGDELHLREEARFELRQRDRPDVALHLALRNWDIQKEPADLALLVEAAASASRPAAAAPALAWAREHQPAVARRLVPSLLRPPRP